MGCEILAVRMNSWSFLDGQVSFNFPGGEWVGVDPSPPTHDRIDWESV